VVAPGETAIATLSATPPATGWFPSPRIAVDVWTPDHGRVTWRAPVDVVRTVRIPQGAAVVDGRLDEWTGEALSEWTTTLGEVGGTEPTAVWLRHDDDWLYLAARCSESVPAALERRHQGRDGHVVFDDRIGLLAMAGGDLVWFYVNPNGAVWDVRRVGGVMERGWDAVEAAAVVGEGEWTAEARFPLAALGDAAPRTLAFDLRRRQERIQTESTFGMGFGSRDAGRMSIAILEVAYAAGTPQEALASVRSAWLAGDYEGFVHQLVDPEVVARQFATPDAVAAYAAGGRAYARERGHPDDIGKLDACLDHGQWRIEGALAVCGVAELEPRWEPRLRRIGDRWYLTESDGASPSDP
jgi:hypothetical protein